LNGCGSWIGYASCSSTRRYQPVGDLLWPIVTDYDKLLPVRIVLLGVWLLLLFRGGVRGRTAALMLIPVIICSDQLSSSIIKPSSTGRAHVSLSMEGT